MGGGVTYSVRGGEGLSRGVAEEGHGEGEVDLAVVVVVVGGGSEAGCW